MLYLLVLLIIILIAYAVLITRKERRLEDRFDIHEGMLRQHRAYADISALLASSRNRGSLTEALLDGAKFLTGSAYSAVLLFGQTEPPGVLLSLDRNTPEGMEKIKQNLERLALENSSIKAPRDLEEPAAAGIKNGMVVPLILRGEVSGELIVANKLEGTHYTEHEKDLLACLGMQAALALKRLTSEETAESLAVTDSLTGLYNHRAFQERMDFELERAKRFGHNLSVLMIDIDDFKAFNSTLGHEAGDQALRSIADTIRENIRKIDFAARYGGEEFALILMESVPEAALKTAERIRLTVAEKSWRDRKLTVSIGISAFPQDGETRDELLQEADGALFIAKKRGKNKVVMAGKFTMAEP